MKKLLALTLALSLVGCAQSMERRLDNVRRDFAAGDFSAQRVNDRNLDPLLAGNALFQQGEFAAADAKFESINQRMPSAMGATVGGEVARALGGDIAADYRPFMMDDLFVSYYQIWAALADGRVNDARVIINQAHEKQRELSQQFTRLIDSREADDRGIGAELRRENEQWAHFSDIMNPALVYLSGIFFLNFARDASDFETARTFLSRADGMVENNTHIRRDLQYARARRMPANTTWVFIHSGFAPRLTERRIDWPVFMGNRIQYISIAVSEPIMHTDMPRIDDADLVADVDAMFMTEFAEYRVNAAIRALAGAVSRGIAQTVAHNSMGPWGGIATTIASIATTNAEVRTWATLPKNISVKRTNERLIKLKSDGTIIRSIEIPTNGNYLVYVRMLNATPTVKLIKLN